MDLPKDYISYSQIRMYQTCPKKYYYTYVDPIPVSLNDKVFLGILFHSVVEHYFKEKINKAEPTRESLVELFKAKFEKGLKKKEIAWDDTQAETRKRGIAFVKYFINYVAPDIDPMMVEKELLADLPDSDVKLKGVIDLVETDFSITDFKTTTAKWSKSRTQNAYLQMVIYRYLFEKTFGDVISRLKFKIIYSKKDTNIKHQEVTIKPGDVDSDYSKMFDIINYVVENIKNGAFYLNESYSCGFCEFRGNCLAEKNVI